MPYGVKSQNGRQDLIFVWQGHELSFLYSFSFFWKLEAQGLANCKKPVDSVVPGQPAGRRHGLVPEGGRGDGRETDNGFT